METTAEKETYQYQFRFIDPESTVETDFFIESETPIQEDASLIQLACQDYVLTDAGIKYYADNNNQFSVQDFLTLVPPEICQRYNFLPPSAFTPDPARAKVCDPITIGNLVPEPSFIVNEIVWNNPSKTLPNDCIVPFAALLAKDETPQNIKMETIKARIPDWIERKYRGSIYCYCHW